jgi:malonyl-CoA O-methyltransferase
MAETARTIDRATLARAQQRMAQAAAPPWLHGEVARRMAERLAVVKTAPAMLIDWWSRAGASSALLRAAYPKARIVRVEPVAASHKAGWWSRLRGDAASTIEAEAVPAEAAQLVWANMMLHTLSDPAAALAQWKRALAVDGFLMFSTLGPDTCKTLRAIYRDAGWGSPHAPFVDMHDLGDMLVHAGFADPVMDQELLRLTWASGAAGRVAHARRQRRSGPAPGTAHAALARAPRGGAGRARRRGRPHRARVRGRLWPRLQAAAAPCGRRRDAPVRRAVAAHGARRSRRRIGPLESRAARKGPTRLPHRADSHA